MISLLYTIYRTAAAIFMDSLQKEVPNINLVLSYKAFSRNWIFMVVDII